MKPNIPALVLLIIAAGTSAQAQTSDWAKADTIQINHELEGVVVEASPVLRRSDRDVYTPSADAVKFATDGIGLLRNLQIPTLSVNTVMRTISDNGQTPQLRINGRIATVEEVFALQPANIKRVEYIDLPGARYGGATSVIDFIVRNPSEGGSLQAQAMQLSKVTFGGYNLGVQINKGKSQWALTADYNLRHKISVYRRYEEHFASQSGVTTDRIETPIEGYWSGSYYNPQLSYSYTDPDRTTFFASIGMGGKQPNSTLFRGRLDVNQGEQTVDLYSFQHEPHTTLPVVNLYLDQKLAHKQTLAFDFSTSHRRSTSSSEYTETVDGTEQVNVGNSLRDRSHGYRGEADYIKDWSKTRLTAGAIVSYTSTSTRYLAPQQARYRQREYTPSLFAELTQRIGTLTLTGSLTGEYIATSESGKTIDYFSLLPRASAVWRASDVSRWNLYFRTSTTTPTLTELSAQEQQIDGFQWSVGNPDLRPYRNYRLGAGYSLNLKRISLTTKITGRISNNAIFDNHYWSDDRLIATYDNSGRYRLLSFSLSPRIELIPDWLSASGSFSISREWSLSDHYRHTLNDFWGNASIDVQHWGFALNFSYMRQSNSLWGEQTNRGENFNSLTLSYAWRDFVFSGICMMPFGTYSQEQQLLNRYSSTRLVLHSSRFERSFGIQIGYNLQWGKQLRAAKKLIEGEANTKSTGAAGR